jgi:Putative DNA-binding domain
MTNLADLQQGFLDWLRDRPGASAPIVTAQAGLEVYHYAYRAQLREALGETFEKCWGWLGDDLFDEAVSAFIAICPPKTWSLSNYGSQLPGFLSAHFPDDPEIAELACLEWALHVCFSGPDATPVDLAQWAEQDWERAILILVPTYAEVNLSTNVVAIWRALAEGVEPPPAGALPKPVVVRIWRKGFSPHFAAMDDEESRALSLVQQNKSFGEICAVLQSESGRDDITVRIGSYLSLWYQDEIIARVV